MRWLVAVLVALPVLVATFLVTGATDLGGCNENIFEGTSRGDVCGALDHNGVLFLLVLGAPLAVFTAIVLTRGRTLYLLLAGIVAVAATVHGTLLAIVTGNLAN